MVIKLYIGSDKLDLFEDENIEVNSSIADVSDITKNTTEYTKSFTVPASASNNLIFKHYYNANLIGSEVFDARIKVEGFIELDGIPFKYGKFRLSKVSIKKGVPYSYTINFWGNLTNIKDTLKKDEISDLNLEKYNHAYNSDNVKEGLRKSLFNGDIIYTLFTKKQLYYNSDPNDSTQTETLSNISLFGGDGAGVIWNDLRPSIRLIKIIEAIEEKYTIANGYKNNIVFSRDFFGRSEFTELFMWLNNDSEKNINGEETMVDFDSGSDSYVNLITNIGSFHAENRPREWWQLYLTVIPSVGYENVEYTVTFYRDDNEDKDLPLNQGIKTTKGSLYGWKNNLHAIGKGTDYTVWYTVKSNQEFKFTTSFKQQRRDYWGKNGDWTTESSEQVITSEFDTKKNAPKLRLIDLLKGLFNSFKLVVIPQPNGTIYVNTLKDYYAAGSLKNITRYVDLESYDVSRGKLLNEINFLFTEPTTLLNKTFEKNNKIAYGDEEAILEDDNGDILDGETLEFTVPFEQFVYERLIDLKDGLETKTQYAAIVDEELKGVNPKAHIFYNINQFEAYKFIGFINDKGDKVGVGFTTNIPSHTNTFEEQTHSFLFGSEFSSWDGTKINNTLYSNYHDEYISSIFNLKRRTFKYSANLPLRVLLELELNDVIEIKGNYYRIDNYNLNLLTGKTDFTLINSFDNTISGFTPDRSEIITDYLEQRQSINVIGLSSFSTIKIDNGHGVNWVSISNLGTNIYFDLSENITGTARDMFIDVINDETLQEFQIYIGQNAKTITIDNNIITIDNNIITIDNN